MCPRRYLTMMVGAIATIVLTAFGKGKPNGNWDGTFRTFDIDISLYGKHDANGNKQVRTDEEKAKYEAILTNFAYVVYEATDGKHRIGKIDIYEGESGFLNGGRLGYLTKRDIVWRESYTKKGSIACARLRTTENKRGWIDFGDVVPNENIHWLSQPARAGACLAHEWGHLEYGFYDEYSLSIDVYKTWPFVSTIETTATKNSLMNASPRMGSLERIYDLPHSAYGWINLSVAEKNKTSNQSISWKWIGNGTYWPSWQCEQIGTAQSYYTGQSCWEQLIMPHNSGDKRLDFPFEYEAFTPKYPEFKGEDAHKDYTVQLTDPSEREKAVGALTIVWHGVQPYQCVICVLDISGSISQQDRLNEISQAQVLVENLPEGAYFGLKSFNETVSTVVPLTKVTEGNRSSIKTKIASVASANGSTALWDAAWASLDEIASFSANQEVDASIILLTDGEDNASKKDKASVVARCNALGVKFNTVAYGSAADANLKDASDSTGGKHYKSGQDSSELGGAFLRTLADSSSRVILADYPCETTKPTTIEKSFFVDSTLTNIHMSVSMSSATEDASVRFISPSGNAHFGSEIAMGGGRSVTFRSAKPELGEWKIVVNAPVPTKATIFADANMLDWGPELNVDVLKNSGIVRAWILNGHSITGAQVVATVPCKGYFNEVPLTLQPSGFYTAPIEAFGPEAKTRGYTVTATIKKGEAWINLGDNFVCDDVSTGSVAVSESATRAEYVPGEGIEESFEGVTFGDGCCVSKTTISSRWPFAGLVDIDYMLSGYQPGMSAKISVVGRDHDQNVMMPATTLTGAGVTTPATNGWNRVTWDLASDYPNFHAKEFSVKVSAAPLMLPASIEASDGTDFDAVIVTWRGNGSATSYQVWRGTNDNVKAATRIVTTSSMKYVDSSAIPGTLYYYWVRPLIGSGVGDYGLSDCGYRALKAPSSVSATSGVLNRITVSWIAVEHAKAYKVYRADSLDCNSAKLVGTTDATSFEDCTKNASTQQDIDVGMGMITLRGALDGLSNLTVDIAPVGVQGIVAGNRYYYWVQAVGQNIVSEMSTNYGTGCTKPAIPSNVSASDGTSSSQVYISWSGISGGKRYKVYRSTSASPSSAILLGTVDNTWYYDTSAQAAKPYYYFVRAIGNACDGDLSVGNAGFRAAVLTKTAPYLVIDLSLGSSATKFPCYELSSIPGGAWTHEYKTTKLVLRRIEAGSFYMGSPTKEVGRDWNTDVYSYEIRHKVTLTKPFYIGVFEVTQKQWELVMGVNTASDKGDARPMDHVTYYQARGDGYVASTSFTGVLRSKTGLSSLDIPTEAQWEYACRAGTTTAVNNGKNLSDKTSDSNMSLVARYLVNCKTTVGGYKGHTTVGSYAPNAWGLYDMHGNVREWCVDWNAKFTSAAVTDPTGPTSGTYRILRGGGYESGAANCRSASRSYDSPKKGHYDYGLRVVLPIQ